MNYYITVPASSYRSTIFGHSQLDNTVSSSFKRNLETTFTPPGRSLGECVDFVFSPEFRKFINASNELPPATVLGEIADYLSACVCKVYNAIYPSSLNEDIPSNSTRPPLGSKIHSVTEIPPIFRNISSYFFKVFIPDAEKEERDPLASGKGQRYSITLELEHAYTSVILELGHFYANGSIDAKNILYMSVSCKNWLFYNDKADNLVIDLVTNLGINYFKKMGAEVYVNDKLV